MKELGPFSKLVQCFILINIPLCAGKCLAALCILLLFFKASAHSMCCLFITKNIVYNTP